MKRLAAMNALAAVSLIAGCAHASPTATPSSTAGVLPTPPDVQITRPAPGLPPPLAAFSGVWEGIWDGALPSRLMVERIGRDSAQVVYIVARAPNGAFAAQWVRLTATVDASGTIRWSGYGLRFSFTMSGDRMTIHGRREYPGGTNFVTMTKVKQ